MAQQDVVGILTWRKGERFSEPDYLRRLVVAGQKLGAKVYLFSHQDVNVAERKIRGFTPTKAGGWSSKWYAWPDVVIDRYRRRVPQYMRLRHSKLFTFANSPFSKKWRVTLMLAKDERVSHWIPESSVYAPGKVKAMLKRFPIVYIKPGNGTGGRSILKVKAAGRQYVLSGRDRLSALHQATLKTAEGVEKWVKRWVKEQQLGDGNFLVQQGVDLGVLPNRVADVRVLIQKDEQGYWSVTGCGVRVGEKGSSTSNLHGGGKAVPFQPFLAAVFGKERARTITSEVVQLAHQTAVTLEERFGRMMEFGLDIGVDVDGRPWLIEVNPKPGREVFREIGDMDTYERAIARPVQFALQLLR